MTEKQLSFINSLLQNRIIPDNIEIPDLSRIGWQETSELINYLKALPIRGKETTPTGEAYYAAPGFYLFNNEIYRVCQSRQSGRVYAKILIDEGTKGRWDYFKGMVSQLLPEHRISLDHAKSFGREHGFCLICGATLTDPKSVAAGIGPICAGRV